MAEELYGLLERRALSGYLRYHFPRFEILFDTVSHYHEDGFRILDIGRSDFTEVLISKFQNVDTLGLERESDNSISRHFNFNLNDCRDRSLWRRDVPKYDIIIFSEVVEHLYTSPGQVLGFLKTLLNKGGVIIIQTPNAVALHKRLKIIFGRNPYELIRENHNNPGHFREYTKKELIFYLAELGFSLLKFRYENHFDYRFSEHSNKNVLLKNDKRKIFNIISSALPGPLKPGMFFVAQNP
ncbi:methyltransferase domain-containing protein [Microbulbifer sp. SSSA005]|uniref:methyltransferase domain-containing protein n=1 Tax=unclassified Microbulbifer TaxID=2619833 RepID=UPI004039CFE8